MPPRRVKPRVAPGTPKPGDAKDPKAQAAAQPGEAKGQPRATQAKPDGTAGQKADNAAKPGDQKGGTAGHSQSRRQAATGRQRRRGGKDPNAAAKTRGRRCESRRCGRETR